MHVCPLARRDPLIMMSAACLICENKTLKVVPAYSGLTRVTSDCKPWIGGGHLTVCETCGTIQKLPDDRWFDEISRIYRDYEIYFLSNGEEQPIFFKDGRSLPRSQVLVDFVVKKALHNAEKGDLIDIGCGNGAAIRNFSRALPHWRIDGNELSDKALSSLKGVSGFRSLHTGSVSEIRHQYDLVSLIHSLEHMPSPLDTMENVARLLKKDGILLVEVPDIETSPFDILVADHLCHFSRSTLRFLVEKIGIRIEFLENTVLPKEITLLGTLGQGGSGASFQPDPSEGIAMVEKNVAWLESVLSSATESAKAPNFGIFGTSISGIWLYGALRDRVNFFVDEDPSRIGGFFDGKPIVSPVQIPLGAPVFIPLVYPTAANVAQRHSKIEANFILPPPMS